MSWTEERSERLKKLWQDGHSASQIARKLGGVTRNAVIGKAHRMGLTAGGAHETRAKPSAPARAPKAPPVKRAPYQNAGLAFGSKKRPGKTKPALVFANDGATMSPEPKAPFHGVKVRAFDPLPGSNPKPWGERKSGQCSWPVGQGEGPELHSCCEPVAPERSWCRAHCAIGTQRPAAGQPRTGNELARSLRRYVA